MQPFWTSHFLLSESDLGVTVHAAEVERRLPPILLPRVGVGLSLGDQDLGDPRALGVLLGDGRANLLLGRL